jgi:hypothetical protein
MQMTKQAAARFLAQKQRRADKQRRIAKARSLCAQAGTVDTALALEILKAQERAAARAAKRDANVARIRGTK